MVVNFNGGGSRCAVWIGAFLSAELHRLLARSSSDGVVTVWVRNVVDGDSKGPMAELQRCFAAASLSIDEVSAKRVADISLDEVCSVWFADSVIGAECSVLNAELQRCLAASPGDKLVANVVLNTNVDGSLRVSFADEIKEAELIMSFVKVGEVEEGIKVADIEFNASDVIVGSGERLVRVVAVILCSGESAVFGSIVIVYSAETLSSRPFPL